MTIAHPLAQAWLSTGGTGAQNYDEFADDAEIPGNWLCRNGMEGTLIEGDLPEPKKVKPPRTHWDMLLERRSVDELDELLKERLDLIRTRRRGS